MDMRIYFPGGKKVYADYNGFTHMTDQPIAPDQPGSAPSPFELFLASLGTCAGIFVLGFCQQRGIDTSGLELRQTMQFNPATHLIEEVGIEIRLPANFPEKYRPAVIQSASLCLVKRHFENPPRFAITVKPA